MKRAGPIAALILAVLNGLGLASLVFVFSDPMGNEIGMAVYVLLATGNGLIGFAAWWMTRRARRREGADRRLAAVAGWIGLAGAIGAFCFLMYGFVVPRFASWLIFG